MFKSSGGKNAGGWLFSSAWPEQGKKREVWWCLTCCPAFQEAMTRILSLHQILYP